MPTSGKHRGADEQSLDRVRSSSDLQKEKAWNGRQNKTIKSGTEGRLSPGAMSHRLTHTT